jgi:hypothetical protein
MEGRITEADACRVIENFSFPSRVVIGAPFARFPARRGRARANAYGA